MSKIGDLWVSADPKAWEDALARYGSFVPPQNADLDRSLETLDLGRLRQLDARGWYEFLKNEYFRWKYTALNRYTTTTRQLQRYVDNDSLDDLDQIRISLLTLNINDIRSGLETASAIRGLGTAGASGLLALMYPQKFGTVDQFVVKALRQVSGLSEGKALARMNPENLTIRDGVVIIDVLQRKAADNNRVFESANWTPRKLDKILWTYGRESKRIRRPYHRGDHDCRALCPLHGDAPDIAGAMRVNPEIVPAATAQCQFHPLQLLNPIAVSSSAASPFAWQVKPVASA